MVTCEFYSSGYKFEWDNFVDKCKTPLFLFKRDFMEYHANCFVDASLMFREDDVLIAVFPANRNGNDLVSHGGLTYGGLLMSTKVKAETVLSSFEKLTSFSKEQGIETIVYKTIPHIFSIHSAQEDLYSLFRIGARVVRRDLSSIIFLDQRLKLSKGRKWLIARAKKNNLVVRQSHDWESFNRLLCSALEKHEVIPVHTPTELESLAHAFPENISLMIIEQNGTLLAGTLLFNFENVVHTQYLATSTEGKEVGALDYLIESCIQNSVDKKYKYFSFGISTERQGRHINAGLMAQKESFGARGMAIDFYEIKLND